MDWTNLGLSTLAVFGFLYVIGFAISILSSVMQCGKTSMTESSVEALQWAAAPSIVYIIASYFPIIRNSFKMYNSNIIAIGFLMMLTTWPMTVIIVNNTERAVCVPSTSEMTAFKTKLLAELKQKQEAEEKNKNVSVLKK
jgi:hypothetical protein